MYAIMFMLRTQQYLIMCPLEVIIPNAESMKVEVPVPIEEAIRLFKVTAAVIPIGMPMTRLNAVMLKQCAALIRDTEGNCHLMVVQFCGYCFRISVRNMI